MKLTVSFFINGHLRDTKQVTTPCIIGRCSQADWVLTHPMLSRNHCRIFDKDGELYLSDEGSLNGTRFKGKLVKETVRLQFGDEFTVGGDLKFCVSAPLEDEQEQVTENGGLAELTTTVFPREELAGDQSTVLSKKADDSEEVQE